MEFYFADIEMLVSGWNTLYFPFIPEIILSHSVNRSISVFHIQFWIISVLPMLSWSRWLLYSKLSIRTSGSPSCPGYERSQSRSCSGTSTVGRNSTVSALWSCIASRSATWILFKPFGDPIHSNLPHPSERTISRSDRPFNWIKCQPSANFESWLPTCFPTCLCFFSQCNCFKLIHLRDFIRTVYVSSIGHTRLHRFQS
jgi:hypothetical protein